MVYREIGKTGKMAGIIGLGCEHLDQKPYDTIKETLQFALDNGVNYLDVFMPGQQVREHIAKALGAHRKDVFIQGHIGSTDINQQYDISRDLPTVKKYFEDLLHIFGGYIDFGMLFFIDSEEEYTKVVDGGIADYARKLKQDGYIGHIGFSSHNPEIAAKVVSTGIAEVVLFSINMAFDMASDSYALDDLSEDWQNTRLHGIDSKRAAFYALCEQKGVGISVMKTLGAGKLLSAEHTPFSKPMTVNQCIHFALSRPSVFSALLGCQSAFELRDALGYLTADESAKNYAPFAEELHQNFLGSCVYCNHCQPCPVNIDIASVNRYLDIARLDEDSIPPSIVSHYNSLSNTGKDCIACGNCEIRCPFGVPVMENMQKASALFGK